MGKHFIISFIYSFDMDELVPELLVLIFHRLNPLDWIHLSQTNRRIRQIFYDPENGCLQPAMAARLTNRPVESTCAFDLIIWRFLLNEDQSKRLAAKLVWRWHCEPDYEIVKLVTTENYPFVKCKPFEVDVYVKKLESIFVALLLG